MSSDSGAEPLFAVALDDPRDRWAALRTLVERFTGLRMRPTGHRSADAEAIATAMGRPLGLGVSEWLVFTEDLERAGPPASYVLRDDRRIVAEGDRLVLGIQAEGDRIWSVVRDDLGSDDPPVWIDWLDHAENRMVRATEPETTVTAFVGRYVFDYLDGGPNVVERLPEGWTAAMAAEGCVPGIYDGIAVYEGPGWIAFAHERRRPSLRVLFQRDMFQRDIDVAALPAPIRHVHQDLMTTLRRLRS